MWKLLYLGKQGLSERLTNNAYESVYFTNGTARLVRHHQEARRVWQFDKGLDQHEVKSLSLPRYAIFRHDGERSVLNGEGSNRRRKSRRIR